MPRPPLSTDNRTTLTRLIAFYGDLLLPDELEALWKMWGHPALTGVDRLRLTVIASRTIDRAAAEEPRDAA
jgi:hypothetical protein